jgi:hypothetical protein
MEKIQEVYQNYINKKINSLYLIKKAQRDYPNIIPNATNINEVVNILKRHHIIYEQKTNKDNPIDWFKSFNEKMGIDNHNISNEQFIKGYDIELQDPKNKNKDKHELEKLVQKNLDKDPLYYVKSGQFGNKDIGYVESKKTEEPKGKYKSSGYGNLSEAEYYDVNKKPKTRKIIKPKTNNRRPKKSTISNVISNIEKTSNLVALESKIENINKEIKEREEKLNLINSNEALSEFIDGNEIKKVQNEIKNLQKIKDKYNKMYDKEKEVNAKKTSQIKEDHSSNPNDKYVVKHSKENNTYQVWEGDFLVANFHHKENAEKYAHKKNLLNGKK